MRSLPATLAAAVPGLGAALLLAAPAAAQCPGVDDAFEDNDDCASAWPLPPGTYPGLYTEKQALDHDYFQVTVPAGEYLTITASFVHADGDIDLALWDAACSSFIDSSTSATDDEQVAAHNTSGGPVDFVVEVYVWSGDSVDCNDYALDIAVFPDPCPGMGDDAFEDNDDCTSTWALATGTYPALSASKSDPDFFEVTVPAGDRLTASASFSHVSGDVDLFLWDLACGVLLDSSSSTEDVETCLWVNSGAAPVDVVVEVSLWPGSLFDCNTYALDLSTAPDPCLNALDDVFEDNDDCASAVGGVVGLYSGLFVSKYDYDYYAYTLLDGDTILVDAYFTHADGDVDIILYDAGNCGGGLGQGLTQGSSVTDDESLAWTNHSGGLLDVVLEVNIWTSSAADCNHYDLEVLVAGAGPIGSNYCGPANSNSSGGPAVISAFGSVIVAANDVRLDAAQTARDKFGMFLNSMLQGAVVPPGSQGLLCLGGGIGRYNADIMSTGATGELSLQLDLAHTPTPGGPVAIQSGESWYFQAWFRDDNPGQTSNFTDGICIAFL